MRPGGGGFESFFGGYLILFVAVAIVGLVLGIYVLAVFSAVVAVLLGLWMRRKLRDAARGEDD